LILSLNFMSIQCMSPGSR